MQDTKLRGKKKPNKQATNTDSLALELEPDPRLRCLVTKILLLACVKHWLKLIYLGTYFISCGLEVERKYKMPVA